MSSIVNVTTTNNNKRTLETSEARMKKAKVAAPKFISARYNWNTNAPNINLYKDKDGNDMVQFQNPSGNGYQVMGPPGLTKFLELKEGGNIGKFGWCADEKTATMGFIYTSQPFPPLPNESAEAHANRVSEFEKDQRDFLVFLKKCQNDALTVLFNAVEPLRETYTKKAKAVMSKDTSTTKLNDMALKLMLKASKSPIKEDNMGGFEFQIKCGAYRNSMGKSEPRPIFVYDGNLTDFPEHPTIGRADLQSRSIVSPVFTLRLYTTPGYKTFGITYQLENRHIILNKNGTNDGGASFGQTLDEASLQQREYQMKGHTNKNGRYNVYVNDLAGSKYLHRMPASKTKYCDLENGTLGKFPGVTEATAKYTATFLEDASNTKYFDHIEALVRDAATFLLNDPNIMKDNKAELRQTAQDVADETAGDVDTTMKNLFMDQIQSPLKVTGEGREMKVSQRMFQYDSVTERNKFTYVDTDCDPIDEVVLERGCKVAPVLSPEIYVLANGTAGVKLSIDLNHSIRVVDNGGFAADGPVPKAYTSDMF